MTFIASVVAKKGVAIIADSLVTSSLPILHYNRFLDHLKTKPKSEGGDISLNPSEVESLFKFEPYYTKDYEEKLFKLNKYTAITTTGIAEINDKKIIDIVQSFVNSKSDLENQSIPIEQRISDFSEFVTKEIREHLTKYEEIGRCIFIITFYETTISKTHIFKTTLKENDRQSLENPNFLYLKTIKEADWIKVVCDGQNKLSDNVLYGIGKPLYEIFPDLISNIIDKLQLPEGSIPPDFIDQLMNDEYFSKIFYGDVELLNLSELSLQQAVDLASLLMRLEVDFQKYTRNVPTVGGLIKLAIIDHDNGFNFISGDNVIPPRHITI